MKVFNFLIFSFLPFLVYTQTNSKIFSSLKLSSGITSSTFKSLKVDEKPAFGYGFSLSYELNFPISKRLNFQTGLLSSYSINKHKLTKVILETDLLNGTQSSIVIAISEIELRLPLMLHYYLKEKARFSLGMSVDRTIFFQKKAKLASGDGRNLSFYEILFDKRKWNFSPLISFDKIFIFNEKRYLVGSSFRFPLLRESNFPYQTKSRWLNIDIQFTCLDFFKNK